MIRDLGCLSVVALLFALSPAVTAQAQQSVAAGASLLQTHGCTACHGAEGRGSTRAPSIAGANLGREAFAAAVRQARGAMPAFSADVLPDEELVTLQTYLAGLSLASPPAGDAQAGAQRYERVGCYSCHSNQGQGVLHGPRIAPRPIRWGRFVWYVRNPAGQMPPYSPAVLSDSELADIYAFLASRPIPPPLDELPLLAP